MLKIITIPAVWRQAVPLISFTKENYTINQMIWNIIIYPEENYFNIY